jgi:hypothetical protein
VRVARAAGSAATRIPYRRPAKASFREAALRADLDVLPVWASESIDLITEVVAAADLVALLATEAEQSLVRAGQAVSST